MRGPLLDPDLDDTPPKAAVAKQGVGAAGRRRVRGRRVGAGWAAGDACPVATSPAAHRPPAHPHPPRHRADDAPGPAVSAGDGSSRPHHPAAGSLAAPLPPPDAACLLAKRRTPDMFLSVAEKRARREREGAATRAGGGSCGGSGSGSGGDGDAAPPAPSIVGPEPTRGEIDCHRRIIRQTSRAGVRKRNESSKGRGPGGGRGLEQGLGGTLEGGSVACQRKEPNTACPGNVAPV